MRRLQIWTLWILLLAEVVWLGTLTAPTSGVLAEAEPAPIMTVEQFSGGVVYTISGYKEGAHLDHHAHRQRLAKGLAV